MTQPDSASIVPIIAHDVPSRWRYQVERGNQVITDAVAVNLATEQVLRPISDKHLQAAVITVPDEDVPEGAIDVNGIWHSWQMASGLDLWLLCGEPGEPGYMEVNLMNPNEVRPVRQAIPGNERTGV